MDTSNGAAVKDFKITPVREIQETKLLRAVARQVFDRGNRGVNISFTCVRLFSDPDTAAAYLLNHENTFPSLQLADVIFTTVSGSVTTTLYLRSAAAKALAGSIKGATTTHNYEFIGGIITTT
jgi:hypothetical protein